MEGRSDSPPEGEVCDSDTARGISVDERRLSDPELPDLPPVGSRLTRLRRRALLKLRVLAALKASKVKIAVELKRRREELQLAEIQRQLSWLEKELASHRAESARRFSVVFEKFPRLIRGISAAGYGTLDHTAKVAFRGFLFDAFFEVAEERMKGK